MITGEKIFHNLSQIFSDKRFISKVGTARRKSLENCCESGFIAHSDITRTGIVHNVRLTIPIYGEKESMPRISGEDRDDLGFGEIPPRRIIVVDHHFHPPDTNVFISSADLYSMINYLDINEASFYLTFGEIGLPQLSLPIFTIACAYNSGKTVFGIYQLNRDSVTSKKLIRSGMAGGEVKKNYV